jgi:hypothetical protein
MLRNGGLGEIHMIHKFTAHTCIVRDQNAKQTDARRVGYRPRKLGQFFVAAPSDTY